MKSKGLIVGGGNIGSKLDIKEISKDRTIIGVDSGYDKLKDRGLEIDHLIGDFDSIKAKLSDIEAGKIVKTSFEDGYNYTDMELAINLANDLGLRDITILGALGGRMDHSMANIMLLRKLLEYKVDGRILDDNNLIQVKTGSIKIKKGPYKYLSVLPIFEGTYIDLQGFKYPLDNYKLSLGQSRTISNEIINDYAQINSNKEIIIIQANEG